VHTLLSFSGIIRRRSGSTDRSSVGIWRVDEGFGFFSILLFCIYTSARHDQWVVGTLALHPVWGNVQSSALVFGETEGELRVQFTHQDSHPYSSDWTPDFLGLTDEELT
jgi:hypothetical protein